MQDRAFCVRAIADSTDNDDANPVSIELPASAQNLAGDGLSQSVRFQSY
jgi:hypothetical protein